MKPTPPGTGAARTKLTLTRGWERQALALPDVRDLVAERTGVILHRAITNAPRRGHGSLSWNSIKNNIDAHIQLMYEGWYGWVVLDEHPEVWHAWQQERGFTSPRGRKIKGRRFLKSALLQARVK